MENVDTDSQGNYQEENIFSFQHLTREMERLRQTVEDRDNDPRDAIQHLEHKLSQLAITLCPPLRTHLGSIRQIYRQFV